MNQTYGTAYYIAPEVLQSDYNEKCDVWSIGVILYILLSGKPPFDGRDDREIVKRVKLGTYSLNGPEWKNLSKDGTDLIKKMLTYDPKQRISAEQALVHPWIKKKVFEKVDEKSTIACLNNLRGFRVNTYCILKHYRLNKKCSRLPLPSSLVNWHLKKRWLSCNVHSNNLIRIQMGNYQEKS